MAIGCRAQQLVANKCFGKCTVRSADYHKRARPICTLKKNVIQQTEQRIYEQYRQNYRTLYTSKSLAGTPRLSPQEVSVLYASVNTYTYMIFKDVSIAAFKL
jgi:hypothetical protein